MSRNSSKSESVRAGSDSPPPAPAPTEATPIEAIAEADRSVTNDDATSDDATSDDATSATNDDANGSVDAAAANDTDPEIELVELPVPDPGFTNYVFPTEAYFAYQAGDLDAAHEDEFGFWREGPAPSR